MNWELQLIGVYLSVCSHFQNGLGLHCLRMSNNAHPAFTDEEVITLYLFGIMQKCFTVREIYDYTRNHLFEWFPTMPSYPAYVQRLNRLTEVFPVLTEHLFARTPKLQVLSGIRLLDSMPILMAKAKRSSSAKVAAGLANKGYCASKDIYFYGVKLHVIAMKRFQTLPLPEYLEDLCYGERDIYAITHEHS